MKHGNASGLNVHTPITWVYADSATRLAASGFTSVDLYKFALQLDTGAIYLLSATTPTWIWIAGDLDAVGGSGGGDLWYPTLTTPIASSFTGYNNGPATLADADRGLIFSLDTESGGTFRGFGNALSSTTFTLTIAFHGLMVGDATGVYPTFGLFVRNSSSGKIRSFHNIRGTGISVVETYGFDSYTPGFEGANFNTKYDWSGPLKWYKLSGDGTYFYMDISEDGTYWTNVYNMLQTTSPSIGTVNTCGFYGMSRSALGMQVRILHYEKTLTCDRIGTVGVPEP